MTVTEAQRGDERFDVVDGSDRVVGQATREVVHRDGLLHRAVHIWVFRADGQVLLQKRSALKDQYPLTWTSSASGHVDAGETYDAAASRELQEELQLSGELAHVTTLPASARTAFEFTSLWTVTAASEPVPNPAEIVELRWWLLDEVIAAARENTDAFSPPLRELALWWADSRRTDASDGAAG